MLPLRYIGKDYDYLAPLACGDVVADGLDLTLERSADTMLGGAVITETIFGWPGVGHYTVLAIQERDFPVVQAAVLLSSGVFIVLNLAVDLLYGYLDPRIRYS